MRAIFLILILVVLLVIAALATGMVDIRQTSPATAPTVTAQDGKINATPGTAPTFDIETGTVGVGTNQTAVKVPSVEVKRDGATVAVPTVEVRRPADPPATSNAQ